MRIELTSSALKEENLFPNKFVPILANYDPLALLTSTTTTPKYYLPPPKYENKHTNRPHSIHQFSFVDHHYSHSPNNVQTLPRPIPPPIILSSMHQPTAPSHLPPARKPSHNSHRKPFKLDHFDGSWDIKFNISNELRELLKLEQIKLVNFSQVICSKSKWIITSSRSKHRDSDIFVARANNPFGHSTKWKLR